MTSTAIDLSHVSKTYGNKVHALRGISMRVERGEIFGLLGPNGAGKSTLVKILMTVIRPTQAKGTMLGSPVGDKQALAKVGYLPEHHRFPEYLTGRQVIDFYGAMAGAGRHERHARCDELLELVGMSNWADTKVKGYSKGMRQRIGIAQALVNNPDLVVLDEPTDGVDPVGRRDIRNILVELKRQGRTVFLNSHLLSELEMVCDRVAILVQGSVASHGTIDQLTAGRSRYEIETVEELESSRLDGVVTWRTPVGRLGSRAAEIAASSDGATSPPSDDARSTLAIQGVFAGEMNGGTIVRLKGHNVSCETDSAEAIQPIIDALRSRGVTIRAVRSTRPSLEDLFMEAVTDRETGAVFTPGAAMDAPKANDARPRRPDDTAPKSPEPKGGAR